MDLLHVSYNLPRLLAVSFCLSDLMEFVHVSHTLPLFLEVSHCLFGPMELLHVSHSLPWLFAVSPVPWSCYISLIIFHGSWLSPTVTPSTMDLLHISHYF